MGNLVAKKKELVLKDKKTLEEERDDLAKQLSMKEREYEQMKGHKFMKRDEFKNYAASSGINPQNSSASSLSFQTCGMNVQC